MLMRNMLRTDVNLCRKNTGKENGRPDKKNQNIKDIEERLKRQEEKENRKYLNFILNLFDHYTVLRSSS